MWSQSQIPRMCSDWDNKWSWFWPFVHATPLLPFFLHLFVEPWTWGFLSSLSSSACLSRWILHFILHKVRNHILKDLAVASCLSLHTRLQGLCVRAEPSQCPCPRRTLSPSDPTTEQSVCILDQKRNLSSSTLVIRIYVVFNNPPPVTAAIVCWTSPCESLTCKSVSRFGF